jgi:hypothetical protein
LANEWECQNCFARNGVEAASCDNCGAARGASAALLFTSAQRRVDADASRATVGAKIPVETTPGDDPGECPVCGTEQPANGRWCPTCHPLEALEEIDPTTDPILVRNYGGRTQADAAALFRREALLLVNKGYRPVSQSWADGRPGVGRAIVIGRLATAIRPDGTLTVTYQFEGLSDATKACPRCAETIKAAAVVCRFCGHEYVAT